MSELSTVPYALVVDDEPFIIMDIVEILEQAGFRCFEADTAEDALAILGEHAQSIVLLFTDVDMSGMNGFELSRRVAAGWDHVEIVVASGARVPVANDLPPRATFIRKPFNSAMVHGHLRHILPDGKKPEPLRHAV